MSSPVVKIIVDPNPTIAGVQRVNAALNSVGTTANRVGGQVGNSANGFVQTGGAAQKMAQQMQAANGNAAGLSGMLGRLQGAAGGAASSVGGLAQSFAGLGGIGIAGGVAAIGAGVVAVGAAMMNATAKVEEYKASLTTIVGDATKAGQAFDALAAFAQKTPFTLDQAVDGFIKLKALGLTPSEAAMTSYGNTSAAMGKSLSQMIEAVADASTGEFERLKEFGIKSKQQGDNVSFTFQGVTTKVGKNSEEIQKYLIDIGNTKFAGGMERQAKTISGALSGLSDQVFLAFAKMGQGGFSDAITDIINGLTTGLQKVQPLLNGIGSIIGGIVNIAGNVISGIASVFNALQGGAGEGLSYLDKLGIAFNIVGQVASVVGDLIGSYFRGVANVISWLAGMASEAFGSLFKWLGISTGTTTASMGLSFVGILRAVKSVAKAIPELFSIAFQDVKSLFSGFGSIVSRLLTGDITALADIGDVFSKSFANSAAKMGSIVADATRIAGDAKGAQAAVDKMMGKGSGAKIDDFAGGAPKPTPNSSAATAKPDKSAADAAKAAEQRQKSIDDYWRTLENTLATSKLLPLEAEKLTKYQELQKLYGDKLSDQDKAALEAANGKLDTVMREIAVAKALTGLREQTRSIEIENLVNGQRRLGLSESEKIVEDALMDRRKQALVAGASLADIMSETYQTEEKRLETALKTKAAYDGQAAALAKASSIAAKYSPSVDRSQRIAAVEKDRADYLSGSKDSDAIKKTVLAGMDGAIQEIKSEALREWGDAISQLGDEIGGKWGKAISKIARTLESITAAAKGDFNQGGLLGSIANLLGSNGQGGKNAFGSAVQKGAGNFNDQLFGNESKGIKSALADPLKSMSSSIDGFKNAFDPAKGGSIVKGLGNAVGGAMQGAQMGTAIAGVGKMLWSKFSTTGAQIGGALGSFAGPIGSAIGSLLGGTIGGLLKKTTYGTASIGAMAGGELGVSSLTGNSANMKGNSSSAAGTVISGLQAVAADLGATLSGSPSVSIGQYKGKWRVSDTGRTGKLKGKYDDVEDFGKDGAEAAIAYAIQVALQDGILTGISEFSQKVIKASGTDEALNLAKSYESILKSLKAYDDPLQGIVDDATSALDTLAKQMQKAGASASDLANVERYRQLQLDKILNDQLSSLNDFRASLSGEGSGVSGLDRLNTSLNDFSTMRADVAAGKTLDQDAFTRLGSQIFALAGDVYGTSTSDFQSIRSMLLDATDGAILDVKTDFADATTAAIQQQTTAIVQQQQTTNDQLAVQNDLLRQLIDKTAATKASTQSAAQYVNGRLVA
ncbi:MAG: tape measure protein [Sphingobium sp.]